MSIDNALKILVMSYILDHGSKLLTLAEYYAKQGSLELSEEHLKLGQACSDIVDSIKERNKR